MANAWLLACVRLASDVMSERMAAAVKRQRAPRNRTLVVSDTERREFSQQLLRLPIPREPTLLRDRLVLGDTFDVLPQLPPRMVDLLILDPPYNLTRTFGESRFHERRPEEYEVWFEGWFRTVLPCLKPTATLYVCGDWRNSSALHRVLGNHVIPRNRITWERETGRGASKNWKNASEDIWFCTVGKDYYFNVEAVQLKRRVIAPYRANGTPKGWNETAEGNFRLTHPSNLWTDLTVPFWSMPENTDHPTQKPEKLMAKLILASSRPGDIVLDPFLGSGTSAVVARKLGRSFLGIEREESYACLALKRLARAERDTSIQGYSDFVFWERNSSPWPAAATRGHNTR
jgi:site-specific DNA-methyltransferase (adenine-specific)